MKYAHTSKHRRNCPHDPDYRLQMGHRLRLSRCTLGWSLEQAAKYFQVTPRTWHNWEIGAHRIPFAVYKLCRVLARLELPGDAWAGWSFQGGALVTPEGRRIEPKESAWWSLMVHKARSFLVAHQEAARLRGLLAAAQQSSGPVAGDRAAGGSAAGLVSYKTTGNVVPNTSSQNDVIMRQWPILSDSQTPWTPQRAPKPNTSASPLTPCFVLPWTPICAHQQPQSRPTPGPCQVPPSHLKQQFSQLQSPPPNPSLSSPEPKSRRSTSKKRQNESAFSVYKPASAKPAQAAKAAALASTPAGTRP